MQPFFITHTHLTWPHVKTRTPQAPNLAGLWIYTMKLRSTTCSSKVATCPSGTANATTWRRTHKQVQQTWCAMWNHRCPSQKDRGNIQHATIWTTIQQIHMHVKRGIVVKVPSNINMRTASASTQKTRRRSPSPRTLKINTLSVPSSGKGTTQIPYPSISSLSPSFCKECYDIQHFTPRCILSSKASIASFQTIRSGNIKKFSDGQRQEHPSWTSMFRGDRFRKSERRGSWSLGRSYPVSQTEKHSIFALALTTRAGGISN